MADIDLTKGDPARGDDAGERRRRRRERSSTPKPTDDSGPSESEVRVQLGRAFDGLAKSREARGDDELADAFREEGDAMTEGFVTLTNNVKPLRMPVIIVLNLLITLLAFGKVGGILIGRLAERRATKQAEQAAAAGIEPEYDASPVQ